jgi:hypothetical protein
MNNIKREEITHPQLGNQVYHDMLYNGEQEAEVVGIRKDQVELYCDMSGGTHGTYGAIWFPIKGTFVM